MDDQDRYTIVTIQNIDTEDFHFAYNKRPYMVAAGEVRRFPKFLAEHCMKHLIDHILNKKDIKTSNVEERSKLATQIYVGEERLDAPPVKNEDEIIAEQVADLNKPSDLENILSKKREEINPIGEITEGITSTSGTPSVSFNATTASTEEFVGLKDTPPPSEKPVEESRGEVKAEPNKAPTKEDIRAYVVNDMKLTFDKNMEKEFEEKTVEQLVKTFSYPVKEE